MKKVERQRAFVQAHRELFRCPVCGKPMQDVVDNSLVCVNGHHFDFNRHGYLHFLNGAANTEYGRAMFESRRRLLSAGLFYPIIEEISRLLPSTAQRILDVGTGEGTPLLQLSQLRQNYPDTMIGFDISKPGIILATQLPLTAFFCVADLRQLPFNNDSFDAILELFSPSDYQEFNRVLAPGGQLIKVVPNAEYLVELRRLLYNQDEAHQQYDNSQVISLFKHHYPTCKIKRVRYQYTIPVELKAALVEMTPLHWGKNAQQLTTAQLAELTSVTVDVSLLIAQK